MCTICNVDHTYVRIDKFSIEHSIVELTPARPIIPISSLNVCLVQEFYLCKYNIAYLFDNFTSFSCSGNPLRSFLAVPQL